MPNTVYWYRLKQLNNDGIFTYSYTVEAQTQLTASLSLSAFPNPAKTATTVQFSLPISSQVSMNLYSMDGKLIKEIMKQNLDAGNHTQALPLQHVKAGNYIIKLTCNSISEANLVIQVKE